MGQEKGRNQWKSHEFLSFDDMKYNRAGLYLSSLDSTSMLQIQTRCTISTDVSNSTEANLQIKCSNLQLRNKNERCKEVQNKIIKSESG